MCIKCTWGAYNMSFIIHTFLFDVVVKDVSTLRDANLELCTFCLI